MAKENVESLCQRAQQAIAQGQNEQARQLYLQALALRSDVPDVHYGIATVCFLLNDLAGAAYHFKEAADYETGAAAIISPADANDAIDAAAQFVAAVRSAIVGA